MNILIVYAHPYEKSFNNAILKNIVEGMENTNHKYKIIDLYKEKFNPVMTSEDLKNRKTPKDKIVLNYQKKINEANHVIFIFPIWFENVPAILKGFIDKVFTPGFAYEYENNKLIRKLTNKRATVITTMSTNKYIYKYIFKNNIKYSFNIGSLMFFGINKVKWFNMSSIFNISDEKRKKFLEKVKNYCTNLK